MWRFTIANVKPHAAASWLQEYAHQWNVTGGTVTGSLGWGSWGIEKGATFEIASDELVEFLIADLLRAWKEKYAYVTVNGVDPHLRDRMGARSELEGEVRDGVERLGSACTDCACNCDRPGS